MLEKYFLVLGMIRLLKKTTQNNYEITSHLFSFRKDLFETQFFKHWSHHILGFVGVSKLDM
jgi:hypothetical protein